MLAYRSVSRFFSLPKNPIHHLDLASGELQVFLPESQGGKGSWMRPMTPTSGSQFLAGVIKWESFFHQKLNGTLRYSGVGVRSLGPVGDFLQFWGNLKTVRIYGNFEGFFFITMHWLGLVIYNDGLLWGVEGGLALIFLLIY